MASFSALSNEFSKNPDKELFSFITHPEAFRISLRAWLRGFLSVLQIDIRQNTPDRHAFPALAGHTIYPHECALRPLAFLTLQPKASSSCKALSMSCDGCLVRAII